MARDRRAQKDKLSKRINSSIESKDSGGSFKGILNVSKMKEDGYEFFKCDKGDHTIDIIPFESGPNDPEFEKGRTEEGDPTYMIDIFVHTMIGASESTYICMKESYGKPCPVCEEIKNLQDKGEMDDDLYKKLKPKRRGLYNVRDRMSKEKEQKKLIWDSSHWLFEKQLAALAHNPRTGGVTTFADVDDGKYITFTREGDKLGTKYTGMRFDDRDRPVSDAEWDAAANIQDYLNIPSYDELYNEFHGISSDEPEQKKEDTKRERPSKKEDKSESEIMDEEVEEVIQDEDRKSDRQARREARLASKKEKKEDSSGPVCPAGGTFGKDLDELDECLDCPLYEKCEKRWGELQD